MKKNRKRNLYWIEMRKTSQIMRLLTLFLFCTVMHLSATVHSQNVSFSFNLRNGTFEDLIEKISKKGDYYFIYKDSEVAQVVNLNKQFKSVDIHTILKECLAGTDLNYTIEDHIIFIKSNLSIPQQENKTSLVKGTVKDVTGNPLPGVTILIQGTSLGVVTDANGVFQIAVPNHATTLVFSFIGMES